MKLTVEGKSFDIEMQQDAVVVGGTPYKVVVSSEGGQATVKVAGRPYKVTIKDDQTVVVDGREYKVEASGRAVARHGKQAAQGPAHSGHKGAVRALMPGKVLSVRVKEGEHVAGGAVLLILEAMKMENEIKAPEGGTVKRVAAAPGQTVNNGDVLVVIE